MLLETIQIDVGRDLLAIALCRSSSLFPSLSAPESEIFSGQRVVLSIDKKMISFSERFDLMVLTLLI